MIANAEQFQQTLEQLERMYRALALLRQDVLPQNPRQFAVLAEAPLDHVRRLQEELEQYRLSLLAQPPAPPRPARRVG
jgi:hypothetical protein